MDKRDYLILAELLKDAQTPFATIAKKLGVSPQTIISRYEKMRKEGIIKKCVLSIDPSKLGFQGKAFLMITNSPNQSRSVTLASLKKIKNVLEISEIMGAFDILAIALVADLNSITTLVNAIKKLPSVERVEVAFISDTTFPAPPNFSRLFSGRGSTLATGDAQAKSTSQ
jgi:Lrp/AsnC family transcriptional regulator, regulator for asnA, asnC and gidA